MMFNSSLELEITTDARLHVVHAPDHKTTVTLLSPLSTAPVCGETKYNLMVVFVVVRNERDVMLQQPTQPGCHISMCSTCLAMYHTVLSNKTSLCITPILRSSLGLIQQQNGPVHDVTAT